MIIEYENIEVIITKDANDKRKKFIINSKMIDLKHFKVIGHEHLILNYCEREKHFTIYNTSTLERFGGESIVECFEEYEKNIKTIKDFGRHYRYTYSRHLTEIELDKKIVTVKFDPYRICDIYNIGGGPREHMVKKLLRMENKGHSVKEVLREIRCSLDRWEEMLKEDQI